MLVGEVAAESGYLSPWAFAMAACIAAITGSSYAKLSARMPKSAGEAVYVHSAFGQNWLTILTGWTVVFTGLVSAAVMAQGFVGYFQLFFAVSDTAIIVLLIGVLTGLACWGVQQSVSVAVIITLIEVGGLVFVCSVGADQLALLTESPRRFVPGFNAADWLHISAGAFIAFYAFIGFEDIVNMAEEVKNPRRNLPLAIALSMLCATLLYALMASIAVVALPLNQLAGNAAPLAAIVTANSDYPPTLIGIISLIAVINGALIQLIMASRVLYGMARESQAPAWLGHCSEMTQTPIAGTLLVGIVIIIFALALPLASLARLTSTLILLLFAVINLALVKLLWKENPQIRAGFVLPVSGAILNLGFVALQLIH